MYICGLIPRNFAELAEAVSIVPDATSYIIFFKKLSSLVTFCSFLPYSAICQ